MFLFFKCSYDFLMLLLSLFTIKLPSTTGRVQQLMLKMKRQTLTQLLLAWLLLAASQHPYFTINVQAVESGNHSHLFPLFSIYLFV